MTGLEQFGLVVTALIHAAGLAAALRAAATAHTAQGAVAWAVALVSAPWFALPAYALFGPLRGAPFAAGMERARAAARAGDREGGAHAAPVRDAADAALRAPLERLAPAPVLLAPRPSLLIDGEATFDAIFAAVDSARSRVFVQFYIVRDDRIGAMLAERLAARAREGVRVLFLYDEVGARGAPDAYWSRIEEAGVEVRAFSIASRLPKLFRLNYRNHRKAVIVDGDVAIVGGPNVGDEYLGRDPELGPWRDTAIRLKGAAAGEVERIFLEDWNWTGGEGSAPPARSRSEGGATPVLALPTGPADTLPACSLAFLHLVTSARERLWIASPYFVPDLDLLSGLKLAALRGVDVRILIPDRADHRIVWLAAYAYAEEAIRAGIVLRRYTDGFMHQKALVVDDAVAAIGSANLDTRSFRLNFELTPLVFDPGFAAEVAAMLARDFDRSCAHDEAFQASRGLMIRTLAPAARLFAPLL